MDGPLDPPAVPDDLCDPGDFFYFRGRPVVGLSIGSARRFYRSCAAVEEFPNAGAGDCLRLPGGWNRICGHLDRIERRRAGSNTGAKRVGLPEAGSGNDFAIAPATKAF